MFRIGHGYDVHKLVEGRKLILCGAEIPYERGLLGHSDADVAVHALMDAMLGAAALGDIGRHFPDNDSRYEGISSLILLTRVNDMLKEAGCRLGNADITILAQRPKLASYIPQMVTIIADTLKTDKTNINVKATTEEGLGFTGSGEGIAAHAVVLIEKYEL
ncbi:MAG: 2-C-methyl-D-erythritol 2,4-cyclodiphosphate synthase [Papillibacter sp.]|jgi:2-C-methyl-D-erythritol 2,4-cyclodiphosphate synthase|nr:2-C-methyl-D-erythritol 2,4-cyclodiphosphate synthase [Papillibacter sp.]